MIVLYALRLVVTLVIIKALSVKYDLKRNVLDSTSHNATLFDFLFLSKSGASLFSRPVILCILYMY